MLTQKHSCWSSCSTTSITTSTSKSSKSSLNSTTEPSILTITSGYMKLLYAFPAPPHSEPSPIYIYINIVFASFPADIMGLFRFILFCRGTCRFFQKYYHYHHDCLLKSFCHPPWPTRLLAVRNELNFICSSPTVLSCYCKEWL